jgi:hypothetical protein
MMKGEWNGNLSLVLFNNLSIIVKIFESIRPSGGKHLEMAQCLA